MKNTTKAQIFAELTKHTTGDKNWGSKVGRLKAVSLTNTRGSSNSSYTHVYYKRFVYVYWMCYIKH